ncbi:MAG: MBL fold metallo-hydrolase [Acidobacteria bacterium]|nr:MBL fold metallo-hydrolase [Acidobacteriota bacterium]
MKACVLALLVLFTGSVGAFAQSGGAAPHVATAKKAAGQDHLALFNNICSPPPKPQPQQAAQGGGQPQADPPREKWYAPPVKVFDNLYYVGMTEYSAWAVTTSAGIIVIDPLYEYSVEEEVVNGLTKLGMDPKQIRYVVVSHAHRDHVGGAALLQERFGARVVMSAADWDWLASDPGRWPKAKRDVVATDGYKLTLGDATLTLHLTPGHTPGTISTVIPLRDGANRHTAILWGGTGFNWRSGSPRYIQPNTPATYWYANYEKSARKMRDVAKQVGADVVLSNHPQYDQSTRKLALMPKRTAGQPHPYVIGRESVDRFLTVAEECATAGPLW